MKKDSLLIDEILSHEQVQHLQDSFSAASKIATLIVKANGKRLTRASDTLGICKAFNCSDFNVQKHCLKNVRQMCAENKTAKKPVLSRCPHTGFTIATVPIMHKEEYLGSWLIGQVCLDRQLLTQAKTKGIPIFEPEQFQQILSFLKILSDTVVELAYSDSTNLKYNIELKHIMHQLDNSAQLLRKFIDSSNAGLYICDYQTGEILMANEEYCRQLGLEKEKVIGQKTFELNNVSQEIFQSYCPSEFFADNYADPTQGFCWKYHNEKFGKWFKCTSQAIYWADSRPAYMITRIDVTQEQLMKEELTFLAFYDRQLKLPNSTKFLQDMKNCFQENLHIICFDVSALRSFNKVYGRENGDKLLNAIVSWVQEQEFADSLLYRIESVDFCLLIKNSSEQNVKEIADKIHQRFAKAWYLDIQGKSIPYFCGVSVCVLSLTEKMKENDILNIMTRAIDLSRANTAVFYYDEKMDKLELEHIQLTLSLTNCVENNMQGFEVHYQPLVELASGTWKGLEALCRWSCPEQGPICPTDFINDAEKLGLIHTLGDWVLETAVRQCKEIGLDKKDGFFVSVNISPLQMMNGNFAKNVIAILDRYSYPGDKLNLEVTESIEFTFNTFTTHIIEELRTKGIKLALDDFGTGYSSFNNLKNLPVSFLKTERNFVQGIEQDNYMQYFYYILSEISHANGMKLIAEGVETIDQLEIIVRNGADYIQGYFFSRPLSFSALRQQLDKFHQVNEAMYQLKSDAININQWLIGRDAYKVAPSMFRLLNKCMQILHQDQKLSDNLTELLEFVGKHFGLLRSYIFVQKGNELYQSHYEWSAPGVKTRKDYSHGKLDFANGDKNLLEYFKAKGMLLTDDVENFQRALGSVTKAPENCAVALFPMVTENRMIGLVGFDNYLSYEWTPEEAIMLWNLAMLISDCIKQEHTKVEVQKKSNILNSILDKTGIEALVSEIETDQVLWSSNLSQEKSVLAKRLNGCNCVERLGNTLENCGYCSLPKKDGTAVWEYENHSDKSYFMVYSSLIEWDEGKKAHLEYSLDITDIKNKQSKIEELSQTDILTQVANRATLMSNLHELLEKAQLQKQKISIVFVTVDKMRQINSSFGFNFGDRVLQNAANCLKNCTNDMVGRVCGAEFVVIFYGCDKSIASKRINKAKADFQNMRIGTNDQVFSFSFGIVENSELTYHDSEKYLSDLIFLAEERMYESKRLIYNLS